MESYRSLKLIRLTCQMIGVGQILETITTFYTELSRILLDCHTNLKYKMLYYSVPISNSLTDLTRTFPFFYRVVEMTLILNRIHFVCIWDFLRATLRFDII